jgi:hypothetical protein
LQFYTRSASNCRESPGKMELAMSRIRFGASTAGLLFGGALAGCSASMQRWISPTPSASTPQAVQFQSQPTGADVRTAQGQSCQTPCVLTMPLEGQSVTFLKTGFIPVTVQITVGKTPKHSLFERTPPPQLIPNPVVVTLDAVPPPPSPSPSETVVSRPLGPPSRPIPYFPR